MWFVMLTLLKTDPHTDLNILWHKIFVIFFSVKIMRSCSCILVSHDRATAITSFDAILNFPRFFKFINVESVDSAVKKLQQMLQIVPNNFLITKPLIYFTTSSTYGLNVHNVAK